MKASSVKLLSRSINARCGKKLYLANIFFILLRLIFLCLFVFFSYTLSILHSFALTLPKTAYYALFSLGAFFSLWYFIICGHSRKRTFYFSGRKNGRVKIFHIIKISAQIKIIYLHILRTLINLGRLVLYLLPCAISFAVSMYFLTRGMPKPIFYACAGLFSALLSAGFFFYLVSMQKLTFLDDVICSQPSLGAAGTMRYLNLHTRFGKFALLKFKLSFSAWLLASVFIFPIPFASAYYQRSLSVYAKSVLKLYVPKPIEKPVVFMKLKLVEN